MKITKSQLKEIIKEEAIKFQKKTILENRRKEIVRELRMLNENVSNKIESIADKHCDGDFNWWNLMEDIKTALKEHFKNCNCSIKDLPDTDDSCGIEIAKGDRSVPLMLKYDDDRGENIIKIVCKDSDETYNYEILSWENSGGESRGYDAFGYEDTTYEEEGVDCDVKNNIIEELINDIEEYLDKKHNSIK